MYTITKVLSGFIRCFLWLRSFFPQVNLILLNLGLPRACLMTKSCTGSWCLHCGWMVILKNRKKGARKRDKQDTNHHHMFPRPSYRHHHFCLYQAAAPPGLSPGESGPQQCVSQLQPHYFKNRAKGHYASDSSGLPIIFYLFFSTL